MLLKVLLEALVMLIVALPVKVRLVGLKFHAFPPFAAIVQVPDPMASVFVPVPLVLTLEVRVVVVTLKPFALNVPLVSVINVPVKAS